MTDARVGRFLREEDGVTAVEYGLIAALIGVVLLGALTALGTNFNAIFSYLATKVAPPAA